MLFSYYKPTINHFTYTDTVDIRTNYLLPAMKTVIITFRKSFTIEGLGPGLEIGVFQMADLGFLAAGFIYNIFRSK
jgi:hypothetical protein